MQRFILLEETHVLDKDLSFLPIMLPPLTIIHDVTELIGGETATRPFGALYATDPIGRRGGNSTRVTDSDFQGEIKLLFLHNRDKEGGGSQGLSGHLMILLCPIIKVNGKL